MRLRTLIAGSLFMIATSGCVTSSQPDTPPKQTAEYSVAQSNPPGIAPDGSVLMGEAAELDDTFRTYRRAVLQSDGKTAAAIVTSETQAYYRRMADAALKDEKHVLLSGPRADCYTALLLRHELSREQLENMSGEELVAFLVDRGHVSKRVTAKTLIGNFEIDGDKAVGYDWYERGEKYWNYKYYFEREDGAWRFNVLPLMEKADTGFYLIKSREKLKSYEATYLYVLEQATGRKPGPEIWSPPI